MLQTTLKSNQNLKKFLFVSSQAAARPNLQTEPLTALDSCNPVYHYGKSKYQAEECAKQYMDKIPLTIVRHTSIYGPINLGPSVTASIISFTRWGLFPMPLPRFIIRIAVYLIALLRILLDKPYRGIFDQLNYTRYNDWRVSSSAARVDFGFEPQISMEDGLTETVQWMDQHSKKEVELV